MMPSITYSWIGQCAAAPLVLLGSAWVLGVFHSYRRHWVSVDLFLVAITSQELVMALQVFAYALLSLLQPELDGVCGALVWSLNATRSLQFATVASLLADRALTCHWPYRYRFSVRRHQLRYHLGVLAAMASLLGVAALMARPQDPSYFPHCATLPHVLHIRLALFMLAVYGVFLLGGVLSIAVVQTSRGCCSSDVDLMDLGATGATNTTSSTSSTKRPLPPSSTNTVSSHGSKVLPSRASSTSSMGPGGGRGMRTASSTTDLLPAPAATRPGVLRTSSCAPAGGSDFRWRTTICVVLLACLINHLPYLTLVALGTFTPRLLPPLPYEHLLLWLSAAEGLLLPLLLLLSDVTFRGAATAACCRGARPPPPPEGRDFKDGEAPFRLFPRDEAKLFPLTNGSLFSSLLSLPSDAPHPPPLFNPRTYRKGASDTVRTEDPSPRFRDLRLLGSSASSGREHVPYNAPYYCRDLNNSLTSLNNNRDQLYSHPNNNTSTIDSSVKEDHIYATLSETFGSTSSFSDGFLNDEARCPSVTTVANDDFEFHDPRTSGSSIDFYQMQARNPCLRQQSYSSSSFSSSSEVLSCGSRAKDDDTLVLCRPRKPPRSLVRRPPAELPPEALGSRVLPNNYKSPPRIPPRNHGADVILEMNQQNITYSAKKPPMLRQCSRPHAGFDNLAFDSDTLEKKYSMQRNTEKKYYPTNSLHSTDLQAGKPRLKNRFLEEDNHEGTLSRKHRVSSLSMSDLDRLDHKNSEEGEEQMMFLLPVKSESMLSLYRLYLAEDDESSGLRYTIEVSRSENDLSSSAGDDRNRADYGRFFDDLSTSPHEIYQKRRRPQSSASKIRRQHKIQRAKGVQMKNKPPASPTRASDLEFYKENRRNSSPNIGVSFGDQAPDGGVRVAIVDKTRRQNGIITIRDPSGLSVQDLLGVLNRAAATSSGTLQPKPVSVPAPTNKRPKTIGVSALPNPAKNEPQIYNISSSLGSTEPQPLGILNPATPSQGSAQNELEGQNQFLLSTPRRNFLPTYSFGSETQISSENNLASSNNLPLRNYLLSSSNPSSSNNLPSGSNPSSSNNLPSDSNLPSGNNPSSVYETAIRIPCVNVKNPNFISQTNTAPEFRKIFLSEYL
ncbi:uncharacterized protein LOC108671838 [Hyalella azteca]|uniref:Uncharacterized protein LOC108671838 n=1 Tax=Hyalella azteca TaxID=294128 RepID=A0A979FR25_HYAAZ|nr:uncharacterized protein LOC108671838 [Hyalella azteca]